MKFIIKDTSANHDSCYLDRDGIHYDLQSLPAAEFFDSSEQAMQWLSAWDDENEDNDRVGHSSTWATVVPITSVFPDLRTVTAYHVVGVRLDEFHRDVIYIGANEDSAKSAHSEGQAKYNKGAVLTKFQFHLWPTETMPDGFTQWMERWQSGQIVE